MRVVLVWRRMSEPIAPHAPGSPDEEALRELIHEPHVRELLLDALVEELEARRSPTHWKRVQPWLAGAASVAVTLLVFFLPALQEQWDRLQSRKVIQRYVELGRDFMEAGRYRLAEETFSKAFELSENRRLDIEELRLEARVEQVSADPTWGRRNPEGLHESDFLYLLQMEKRERRERSRAATLNSYGLFLIGAGRAREAENRFQEAARLDPGNDDPHIHLGNLYGDRGLLKQAEAEYRRAVALDSLDATSRYDLALLLEQTGRAAEARHELARAAEIDPGDADVLAEYARSLAAAGDTAAARAVRARITRLPPAPPPEEKPSSEESSG
jgi:tetratricopeptide (TPR) repeat protein